jgi:hypothetical protein
MKNRLLILILICQPFMIKAQTVEITPFGGYVFAGSVNVNGGYIHFDDAAQYGGMISFATNHGFDIDLIYNRSDTKAQLNSYDYYELSYGDLPVSINYMQVGFTKNFRVNKVVSPFLGMNIGACLIAPKETYSDTWLFSTGIDAGVKIYFAKHFGIRLQGQMYLPIQVAGFTMYAGSGGSGGGVSVSSTLIQPGFIGGLIFRVGKVAD